MFYIYAYLRDRNSKTAEAGTPYYIGKGKGDRAWTRHKSVGIPDDKSNIIIMESNLSELGALALERRYIQWYGKEESLRLKENLRAKARLKKEELKEHTK